MSATTSTIPTTAIMSFHELDPLEETEPVPPGVTPVDDEYPDVAVPLPVNGIPPLLLAVPLTLEAKTSTQSQ